MRCFSFCTYRATTLFLLLLFCILSAGLPCNIAAAEENSGNEISQNGEGQQNFLDQYHSYFTEKIRGPTIWFDNFFGDPRTEEEELPTSFVRFRFTARYTEGEGMKYPVRLRANVKLPRFNRRFRLIVVGDNEEEVVDAQKNKVDNTGLNAEQNNDRTNLGLRYVVYKSLRSRFHFGGGLSLHSPVESYVRMYYRRLVHIGEGNQIKLTETGFWNSLRGFGEVSRVDFERVLLENLTGRMSFFGTYAEESNGMEWGAEINLFSQLDKKSAISFDLGVYGETRPVSREVNYHIATRYRKNMYRPWIFLELEPGVNFPLSDDQHREAVGYMTIVCEVQFTT